MARKPEQQIGDIIVGSAAVIAGPEIAKDVTKGLADITGAGVNPSAASATELGHVFEEAVGVAQGLVGPIAIAGIVHAGFRKMFEK